MCSVSEPVAPDQFSQLELAFIERYTKHLRSKVNAIATGKASIKFVPVYEIQGLVDYVNKDVFQSDEVTIDHICLERSSLFQNRWRTNRMAAVNLRNNNSSIVLR